MNTLVRLGFSYDQVKKAWRRFSVPTDEMSQDWDILEELIAGLLGADADAQGRAIDNIVGMLGAKNKFFIQFVTSKGKPVILSNEEDEGKRWAIRNEDRTLYAAEGFCTLMRLTAEDLIRVLRTL